MSILKKYFNNLKKHEYEIFIDNILNEINMPSFLMRRTEIIIQIKNIDIFWQTITNRVKSKLLLSTDEAINYFNEHFIGFCTNCNTSFNGEVFGKISAIKQVPVSVGLGNKFNDLYAIANGKCYVCSNKSLLIIWARNPEILSDIKKIKTSKELPVSKKKISNLNIEEETQNDIIILRCNGTLDEQTFSTMDMVLKKILKNKFYKIIISIRDVDFISSAGWGSILNVLGEIQEKGGEIVFTEMNPDLFEVFSLMQFHHIFQVFDSVAEAINYFQNLPLQ